MDALKDDQRVKCAFLYHCPSAALKHIYQRIPNLRNSSFDIQMRAIREEKLHVFNSLSEEFENNSWKTIDLPLNAFGLLNQWGTENKITGTRSELLNQWVFHEKPHIIFLDISDNIESLFFENLTTFADLVVLYTGFGRNTDFHIIKDSELSIPEITLMRKVIAAKIQPCITFNTPLPTTRAYEMAYFGSVSPYEIGEENIAFLENIASITNIHFFASGARFLSDSSPIKKHLSLEVWGADKREILKKTKTVLLPKFAQSRERIVFDLLEMIQSDCQILLENDPEIIELLPGASLFPYKTLDECVHLISDQQFTNYAQPPRYKRVFANQVADILQKKIIETVKSSLKELNPPYDRLPTEDNFKRRASIHFLYGLLMRGVAADQEVKDALLQALYLNPEYFEFIPEGVIG